MDIRPATPADAESLAEIDGTIHSTEYLHVDRSGEEFSIGFSLDLRPLREKVIARNALADDAQFIFRQIAAGHDEGLALVAEHDGQVIASVLAKPNATTKTLELIDLRVNYDHRRQGLGTVLLYRVIQEARERELRAVFTRTLTNNLPAARFLQKAAFEISGLDSRLMSNHDLVKETVALLWYASLD